MEERRALREEWVREEIFADALPFVNGVNRLISSSLDAAAARIEAHASLTKEKVAGPCL